MLTLCGPEQHPGGYFYGSGTGHGVKRVLNLPHHSLGTSEMYDWMLNDSLRHPSSADIGGRFVVSSMWAITLLSDPWRCYLRSHAPMHLLSNGQSGKSLFCITDSAD